jgi:hypothetical protein
VKRHSMMYDGCTDVRIFAVAEDGSETALPSYEEALALLVEIRARADNLDAHRATLRRAEEEIGERYPGAAFDVGAALEAIETALPAMRATVKS